MPRRETRGATRAAAPAQRGRGPPLAARAPGPWPAPFSAAPMLHPAPATVWPASGRCAILRIAMARHDRRSLTVLANPIVALGTLLLPFTVSAASPMEKPAY